MGLVIGHAPDENTTAHSQHQRPMSARLTVSGTPPVSAQGVKPMSRPHSVLGAGEDHYNRPDTYINAHSTRPESFSTGPMPVSRNDHYQHLDRFSAVDSFRPSLINPPRPNTSTDHILSATPRSSLSRPPSSRALPPLPKPTENEFMHEVVASEPRNTFDRAIDDNEGERIAQTGVEALPAKLPTSLAPAPAYTLASGQPEPASQAAFKPSNSQHTTPRQTHVPQVPTDTSEGGQRDDPRAIAAQHGAFADTHRHDKDNDMDRLRQYAAQSDSDRLDVVNDLIVDYIDDEGFVKLLEDVEACWRRCALDLPAVAK